MKSNELFENEYNFYKHAIEDISSTALTYDELFEKYKNIIEKYGNFLKYTDKLFQISDIQENKLIRSENEIKSILDNSNQGFLTFDRSFMIGKTYSAECKNIFGDKIANRKLFELLHTSDNEVNELFRDTFEKIFEIYSLDLINDYLSKLPEMIVIDQKYLMVKYRTVFIDGNLHIMLILTDITSEILAQNQIDYLKYHDKLTTLFNRTYLEKVLSGPNIKDMFPIGVIFCDMNGLKLTNDVFGHNKGDDLIISMANIFKSCCHNDEILVRWAGDEFIILVSNATDNICESIYRRIKIICSEARWDPIAPSTAIGIAIQKDNHFDFQELFDRAEKNMYKNKTHESRETKRQIILSMSKILAMRCFENQEHLINMQEMALKLAKCLYIATVQHEIDDIIMLVKLHDIGKVSIPSEILGKKSSLNDDEFEIIKSHSEIGFRMAQSISEPGIANAILSIHERWDGSGYPEGLAGEQIPILSRIISLVEAFDVMTHDRPYKKAKSKEEAILEIENCSGKQFDPNLVRLFVQNVI